MCQNRPDGSIQTGEHALRLAQSIRQQHTSPPVFLFAAPPVMNLLKNLAFRQPAIDGQAKSAFADEMMATLRFERLGRCARRRVIVAADDAHLPLMLNSHLSGAQ